MKRSIKINLFILFAILMTILIAATILLNVFFLEKYYVIKNKESLSKIATNVINEMQTNSNFLGYIENLDRSEGVSIAVADRNYEIRYSSYAEKKNVKPRLPREQEELIVNKASNISRNPIYTTITKEGQTKLIYITLLESEEYVILTKSMKGIKESVAISNQFYCIVGVFMLIIGSIVMFRFAGKVTKPIIEISEIAKDISDLRFDRKIEVYSSDEIGVLAQSINSVSDKLRVSIDELKNDIEFQKTLSRNMSHELKTPIGVIKGYAEGLVFGVAEDAKMREQYIDVIIAECDRMDGLVTEMLELSKLEAENYHLENVVEFDLKYLLSSIEQRFAMQIEEAKIRMVIECEQKIRIHANYTLMERALSNLVSNAIKYNDDNRYILIKAQNLTQMVQITIYNTCLPLKEKELNKLFDTFYKSDKARTRGGGGHGLGLSIVKSIVLLHGGSIHAKSVHDGIEFEIQLPMTDKKL